MEANLAGQPTNASHLPVVKTRNDTLLGEDENYTPHIVIASVVIAVSVVTALVAAFLFHRKRKKMKYYTRKQGDFEDGVAQDLFATDRVVRFDDRTGSVDIVRTVHVSPASASRGYVIQNDDVIMKTPHSSSSGHDSPPSTSDVTPAAPPNSKRSSCSRALPPRTSSPSLELSNLSGLEVSQDSVFDRLDEESYHDIAEHDQRGRGRAEIPDILMRAEAAADFIPSEIKACSSIGAGLPTHRESGDASSEATEAGLTSSKKRKQGVAVFARKPSGRKCASASHLHPDNEDKANSENGEEEEKSKSWCHILAVHHQSNKENIDSEDRKTRGNRRNSESGAYVGVRDDRPIRLMEYSDVQPHAEPTKAKCFSIKGTGLAITEGRPGLKSHASTTDSSHTPGGKPELHHEYFLVEPEADITMSKAVTLPPHMTQTRNEYFLVEPEPQETPSLDAGWSHVARGPAPLGDQEASSWQSQPGPSYPQRHYGSHHHQDAISSCPEATSSGKRDPKSGMHFPDILAGSPPGHRDPRAGRHVGGSLRSGGKLPDPAPRPGSINRQLSAPGSASHATGASILPHSNAYDDVEPQSEVPTLAAPAAGAAAAAPKRLFRAQTLQAHMSPSAFPESWSRGDNHRFTQQRHPSRHAWASVSTRHGGSSDCMRREEGPQIIRLKKSVSEPGQGEVYPENGGCQSKSGWEGPDSNDHDDDGEMYDRLLLPSVHTRPRLRSAPGQMSVVEEKMG